MSDLPLHPIEDHPRREDRVVRIVAKARREIATRDLVIFGATRAWAGVLGIGGALLIVALFFTGSRKRPPPTSGYGGNDS